jgi:hypothetical protein
VMPTPEQQREFVRSNQGVFAPAAGAWGEQGSTTVRLDAVDEEALGEALTMAWRNAVEKGPTRASVTAPARRAAPASRRSSRRKSKAP